MKRKSLSFYFRIYCKILAQDLKSKMSYRADFIISTIGMICTNISGFISFWIMFRNFPSIDGWNYYEILFLYGFSLIERWRGIGIWRKLFLILGLADENYALEVSCTLKNRDDYANYCTMLTALDISYWFLGTTIGALAGSTLPIPHKGIEFVMAALFISILTDQVSGFKFRGSR